MTAPLRLEKIGPWLVPLATLVVFLPVLGFDFVWDDFSLVVENDLTTSFRNVLSSFHTDLWQTTRQTEGASGYFRPLLLLDLWLDRALFGPAPLAHHLHSLLWHTVAVSLAGTLLARRVGPAGWVAATLFALHPVQVEPVTFIAARNDLMAGAFVLAGLLAFERGWLLVGGMATLLGLLSKELVLAMPALTFAWLWALGDRAGLTRSVVVSMGAVVAFLGLRAAAGIELGDLPAVDVVSWTVRGMAFLVEKLLVPVELTSMTHLTWADGTPWWSLVIALLLAVLAAGFVRAGALPPIAFFGLALAPSFVGILRTGLVCDRYLYLPMFGVAWLAALLLARVSEQRQRVIGGVLLVALAVLASHAERSWRDPETLWLTSIDRAPSPYTWGGYAKELETRGHLDEAVDFYRKAVAPPTPLPHSCFNIVRVQLQRGDLAGAIADGERALQVGCERSAEIQGPLSLAYALTGQWTEAGRVAGELDEDATGMSKVVKVAMAARDGDLLPLQTADTAPRPTGVTPLAEQVAFVLETGGDVERARWVRESMARGAPMSPTSP